MSKEFSSLTDKDAERHAPDYLQDPDCPDYSLPSGLSWSSSQDHDRDRSQEDCIRNIPLRLSPRLLLTLASSPSLSPASRQAAYTTDYTPEQLRVGYQGPNLADDPSTKILRLKSPRPLSTVSSGLPLLQLSSCLQSRHSSRRDNLTTITATGDSLDISITPPVLPLCFANALLTLYAVHEPGVDCKLPLLAFCLAAGSLTLFMSLLAIVAGCAVKEALADGRVSEEERRVIWCVANQNNFLVFIQILVFMALFGFVIFYYDKVSFTDPDSPYYCKRNVYVVCSVLAIVMILGGLLALVILGWIRIVDTRRRKRHNNQVKGL